MSFRISTSLSSLFMTVLPIGFVAILWLTGVGVGLVMYQPEPSTLVTWFGRLMLGNFLGVVPVMSVLAVLFRLRDGRFGPLAEPFTNSCTMAVVMAGGLMTVGWILWLIVTGFHAVSTLIVGTFHLVQAHPLITLAVLGYGTWAGYHYVRLHKVLFAPNARYLAWA